MRTNNKRRVPSLLWLTLLLVALGLLGRGGYMQLKGALAQVLLEDAWQNTVASGQAQKPWPWSDTWPVARLRLGSPEQANELDVVVLDGVSGPTLAFGPGWLQASDSPGESGMTVIAGHRDTHFAALKHVTLGDKVSMQDAKGRWWDYVISSTQVVDTRKQLIDLSSTGDRDELLLVTCYPFDALSAGGPLRYVVTAVRASDSPKLEDGSVKARQHFS
ncbi:MAG: class GN sortase [Hahellaceae bacterium]|nr:class GN sortase [Hahellaceae bacterium]